MRLTDKAHTSLRGGHKKVELIWMMQRMKGPRRTSNEVSGRAAIKIQPWGSSGSVCMFVCMYVRVSELLALERGLSVVEEERFSK